MSGELAGIATVVLLINFLGVVIWAWGRDRREDFECAARLPLDEGPVAGDIVGERAP